MFCGSTRCRKGTQAKRLCAQFDLAHISTGDMLRAQVAHGTALGLSAKKKMDAGELVSDDIIVGMLKDRLEEKDADAVVFLTVSRALNIKPKRGFDTGSPTAVVDLDVDDESVVERLCGRLVHPPSGRVYHVHFSPPKIAGKDDETGDTLVQRDDDREETVRERLSVYRRQTLPLKSYYGKSPVHYISIAGGGDIADISRRLIARIQSQIKSADEPLLRAIGGVTAVN